MTRPCLLTLAALACAGCGPDADRFAIELELDGRTCGEPDQTSANCQNIVMACDAEVMLRILPTDDPAAQPFAVRCQRIGGGGDLCELGSLDISGLPEIPNERVEIQIGVWPYDGSAGSTDPDCGPLGFASTGGIDRTNAASPVIGGRTFFEVGSGTTATITLECLDAPALDAEQCNVPDTVHVTVGVNDLDLPVPVPSSIADALEVRVGAPEEIPGGWRLDTLDTTELVDTSTSLPHSWQEPEGAAITFDDVACVQVERTDLPERATTVTCTPVSPTVDELTMTGWYVDTVTLQQIREALGLLSLPAGGIVVGRVLDFDGIVPEAGVTITADTPGATVRYLSEDLSTTEGVTETQSSGLFVSLDADFLTTWSARKGLQLSLAPGFGGPLFGKVTIVVLRMQESMAGGGP